MDAFDNCLRNGRLQAREPDPDLIQREVETAMSELARARTCFADGRLEECVVQGYFSMYRLLRALLLQTGYRDSNLFSLSTGIERLFATVEGMTGLVAILREAKDRKDLVQQGGRTSRKDAKTILDGAEETYRITKGLIALARFPEVGGSEAPPG